jgi:DNA-directed RNA polymerase specialized sigma24 family protein
MLNEIEIEVVFKNLTGNDIDRKRLAINKIYEAFHPTMFRKLRYKFQDLSENEAQDIIQDAFIKITTSNALPREAKALVSWVFEVVEKTALDLFKKAYKRLEIPLPVDGTEGNEGSTFHYNVTEYIDTEDCVSKGIFSFSKQFPVYAAALSMSLAKQSIADIAIMLNRTEGATKVFLMECRKKSMPYLKHCFEQLGE